MHTSQTPPGIVSGLDELFLFFKLSKLVLEYLYRMLMSVDASRCQSEFLRTFIRRHAHRAALPVKRAMTLTDDHIEQLRTLKGLYDEKIINSSEFAAKKAQILGTSIHHTGDNTPQDQDRSQDEDRSEVGSSSKPVKAKEGVNPDGAQRGWTANVKIGGRSVAASTTCAQCGRIFTWGAALKAHQKACKQKNKSSEQIVSAATTAFARSSRGPDKIKRPRKGASKRKTWTWQQKVDALHLLEKCNFNEVETGKKTARQFVGHTLGISQGTLSGWVDQADIIFTRASEKTVKQVKGVPVNERRTFSPS